MPQDIFGDEITISFYGEALEKNEIEVSVVANSLLAFRYLAEHIIHSIDKHSNVAVKVN
jgi:hypothetical protein